MGLGPLAIEWREDLLHIPSSLEHPSALYGAQHVWFSPIIDPNLRGWVCFYCVGLDLPFILQGCGPLQSVGLGPLSSNGAGSPFKQWDWVPFYSVGLRPLLFSGAGTPFILWD